MKRKYRVLRITNNVKEYPEAKSDSHEFPYIVPHVDDEFGVFVVDLRTRNFWKASEFFYMVNVNQFEVKQ